MNIKKAAEASRKRLNWLVDLHGHEPSESPPLTLISWVTRVLEVLAEDEEDTIDYDPTEERVALLERQVERHIRDSRHARVVSLMQQGFTLEEALAEYELESVEPVRVTSEDVRDAREGMEPKSHYSHQELWDHDFALRLNAARAARGG